MAKKIIALFVEGPTEKEFYKAVVKTIHSQLDCAFGCEIQYIDMKGIGNYKRAALRKYNDLQNKNSGAYIYPFLCIDSDVFEFNKKPPFNKKEVIAELKKCGVKLIALRCAGFNNVDLKAAAAAPAMPDPWQIRSCKKPSPCQMEKRIHDRYFHPTSEEIL